MMKKMRNAQLGLCVIVLTVASCDFQRLPKLGCGDGDCATGGNGLPPFGLELLAGDIGSSGNGDGIGSTARFYIFNGGGVAVDSTGNVYVGDDGNATVRKITPAGVVTTLAGTAGMLGSTDGTGAAARFAGPRGIAVDSAGNVYVADQYNYTIRKITPAGGVTTLAGSAGMSGSTDGAGAAARFDLPSGVAVDRTGNVYVGDDVNFTIRQITPAGVVTTLAGTAGMSGSTDGTGAAARFFEPTGMAVDSTGNIYTADDGNNTIRKITAAGVVTTLAGSAGMSGSTDGTGAAARFAFPSGVAVDSARNVYVVDQGNDTVRKVTPTGVVTTLAGTAAMYGSTDGTGAAARFGSPSGVAVDSAGNVYVVDRGHSIIRKVTPTGVVTTLAGAVPMSGSADGTGTAAQFASPSGVAIDSAGNIYVADTSNDIIRKVTAAGVVTTLAGTARKSGSTDGTGVAARFDFPRGVAVDSAGNLYIADTDNSIIRKVTAVGVVTTLAGTARIIGSADGAGAAARFHSPFGITVDSTGNVYVTDRDDHTLRKVTADGVVTTLAGTAGMSGGLDGAGSSARFNNPMGVAVDSAGNVYIADRSNSTIRKVTVSGVVMTLAGSAGIAGSADDTGAAARFNKPTAVAVDSTGNVYVADQGNSTIRKITPTGTTTTIAGTAGVSGILIGTTPRFASPQGLAIVGDSVVVSDANAILLLRHGVQ